MAESRSRVAIIGAGIGGLSLGLALQERGIQADVFEQASELTEIGAAIALSANSIREFARLGSRRPAGRRLHDPHRAHLPALAGREPDRGPSRPRGQLVREAVRRAVLRDPPRRHPEDAQRRVRHRAPAPRLPARQHRPGARLGRAGVRQRPRRARRPRRRRGRGALHGPAFRHRSRRRRLLRDQRLPRHRAGREPAVAARPARHPVLDGAGRAHAALRDRRQRRTRQLLRGRRDTEDLVAPRLGGRRPRGHPRRILPRLASGHHRDDQRCGEPHQVGAVHRPPAAAVVPRPGRHPRRRRPRDAPPPRAGREHLHRRRLRARGAARRRRRPGDHLLPVPGGCGAPAPARSSEAPRSPVPCCTCPTVPWQKPGTGRCPGCRRTSGGSTSTTSSRSCRRSASRRQPSPAGLK